ncbi:RhuM family protein [Lactonifactor longoviformis]
MRHWRSTTSLLPNSERAVQFRKWVNQIAKVYAIKGWVMDAERIKRGT